MSTTEIEAANRRIAERELIEVESQIASLEKAREQPIARDRELGDDFFQLTRLWPKAAVYRTDLPVA